jgi:hypothetical protein
MNTEAKDRLCNHEVILQNCEQIKLSNNASSMNNINKKTSLKRTESKMDDNQQEPDINSDVDYENEDSDTQWKHQGRPNKRGNKAPRTDSFVHGRTITSSTRGYGRIENRQTSYHSPRERERKNEKRNDNHQTSKIDDNQYNQSEDLQYVCIENGYKNQNRINEKHTHNTNEGEQVYVSRHAMKFAVDDRLPPLKIQCEPALKNQEDASILVKEFLKYIEQNFRKLNSKFNQPFGFDHYLIDKNGALICYTNYFELFIFMCDLSIYPENLNNIKIRPILPTRLPAKNSIILKFIDNQIDFDDIQTIVREKLKSVYAIEEMLGTKTYRSRHIRVDLLSQDEYNCTLNSGKFVIGGHLYDVDEYLSAPRILICNKCNSPGHIKKNCKSTMDICKRCGHDKNDGADHKSCCIKCHHCGGDHDATSFKCSLISKFRHELIQKLKNNTHLLPPHIQLYIPQQFRDQRSKRVLRSKNAEIDLNQIRRVNGINVNLNDQNSWPMCKPNDSLPILNKPTPLWNAELRRMQDEYINLKHEYENELRKIKFENKSQLQKMTQTWQLIHVQMKSQSDAITNLYTTVNETLTPIIQSIQTMSNVMKSLSRKLDDKDEQQINENTSTIINDTMATLNSRLQLLDDHFQKSNNLITQRNELMERGMNSVLNSSNEP